MCVYIFAGRFQPFHNGHMQVLQQLLEKIDQTDILVLAVVAPFISDIIKDVAFLESSKEHHLPDRNPWNVSVPLSAIAQIARSNPYGEQILTTLLPRPEYGWGTITSWFPGKRIWVIPDAGEEFDDIKSKYFTKMGDKVIRIPDTTGVSGRELRGFYKKGQYEEFVANVPTAVADIYFKIKPNENAENDFQKRAKVFERHSKWVTDENINNVPKMFFQQQYLGNLLDAGGGTGYLSYYLYKHLKEKIKSISLVDISRNMLDEAKEKNNYPIITHNSSIETFCRMTTRKFDTILIRQVLHYVDDVNEVIRLLKGVLNNNGNIYVEQIVVDDEKCRYWHDMLMQDISKNRRRTFIYDDFINFFIQNGFEVVEQQLTNFEENLKDLFKRRTSEYDETIREKLKSKMEALASDSLKQKMSIKTDQNDNLFFTVKFCHLLLKKNNND